MSSKEKKDSEKGIDLNNTREWLDSSIYRKEMERLQIELVKLQEWVRIKGEKVVVIFEGRDAAGKGGVIQRITQSLNPRNVRIVALGKPSSREASQWYYQRYVEYLPAAGEIVLYDRSWYNRAGVEKVMGFCTEDEYQEFLRSCPEFELMLIRSGIRLIKYWFSVSDDEQIRRLHDRNNDPTKRWKLSQIDLMTFTKWVDISRAKDEMFKHTDTRHSPWFVVEGDDKRRARLNCINHLLSQIPYEDVTPAPMDLPKKIYNRQEYIRPPKNEQNIVPEKF